MGTPGICHCLAILAEACTGDDPELLNRPFRQWP
jgi:hypothetical protein